MVISEASCSDNFHPVRLGRLKEQVSCGRVPCSAITIGVGSFPEFPKSHGPSLLDRMRRWLPQRFPASRRRRTASCTTGISCHPESQEYRLRAFACSHDEARAFDQARPEQVMLQVSDGLSVRADREALSHRAEAETGDLRKDEPHPVCLFSSARQFLDDLPVDRGLRVHEALEVERISSRSYSFHSRRNRLVGRTGLTVSRCTRCRQSLWIPNARPNDRTA